MMSQPPKHIVSLLSVPSEFEATVIGATLEDHGIPITLSGEYTAGFRAEAPGTVQILVNEKDLTDAQQLLAEIQQAHKDIDWTQVDVGEPVE